jgi:MoxR-like ATPase
MNQPAPVDVAASARELIDYLDKRYFERRSVIQTLVYTILAKQHAFLLGSPGTGKSDMLRALCEWVRGAEFWWVLMNRQLPLDDSFGPIDIAGFEATGDWKRKVAGYLPTAHFALVDEIGKAGPASVNPYLMAMNERQMRNGDEVLNLPLITMVGASNELLEPELEAIFDRFLTRMEVGYIKDDGNFAAYLASQSASLPTPPRIDLTDLQNAIENLVPEIKVPDEVVLEIVKLRSALAGANIECSDRRWRQIKRLLQAAAFVDGRDTVLPDDLAVLQYALWTRTEDRPRITELVYAHAGATLASLAKLLADLADVEANFDEKIAGAADYSVKASIGGDAYHSIRLIQERFNTLLEETGTDDERSSAANAKADEIDRSITRFKERVEEEAIGRIAPPRRRAGATT